MYPYRKLLNLISMEEDIPSCDTKKEIRERKKEPCNMGQYCFNKYSKVNRSGTRLSHHRTREDQPAINPSPLDPI
jgi:hypothetical protein